MTLKYDHFEKYNPVNKDTIGICIYDKLNNPLYYVDIDNFEIENGMVRLSQEYYVFEQSWDDNYWTVLDHRKIMKSPIILNQTWLTIMERNKVPYWVTLSKEEAFTQFHKRKYKESWRYKIKQFFRRK